MVRKGLKYQIIDLFDDALNLIWPSLCASCRNRLFRNEDTICFHCLSKLPRTNFHLWPENDFQQLFWGRVKVMYATSYFFFHKKSIFRKLIHKLKYQGEKEIGIVLGREFGYELKNSVFNEIDLILPVPLHPKRQRQRGYNQSEMIGIGLEQGLEKPLDTTTFIRNIETSTQTKKGRYERWQNVQSIFKVTDKSKIKDKHLLVIDDVVTTGATLESCVEVLLDAGAKHVSLATLAIAKE